MKQHTQSIKRGNRYNNAVVAIITCLLVFLIIAPMALGAENWDVPDNKATERSPIVFDASVQKEGQALYQKHCLSCHGEVGKNNSAQLVPLPGDPASDKFSQQTDGALYYKITNGRGLMPRFSNVLKENERWQIIGYMRSYHEKYIQPEIAVQLTGEQKAADFEVEKYNDSTLVVFAYTIKETDTVPLPNTELQLYIKRYFGNMPFGEPVATNQQGLAYFVVPATTPADTIGNLTTIIRPVNQEVYGDAESVNVFQIGIKNTRAALNEKRAIWNVVQKAPWWILLTYTLGVLAVWSIIGYIVLQLVQLRKK
jgi:mono/diheme cytochrome c family protein